MKLKNMTPPLVLCKGLWDSRQKMHKLFPFEEGA